MIKHEKLFQTGARIIVLSVVLMIALWLSWPFAEATVERYSGNNGLFDTPFLSNGSLFWTVLLFLFGLVLTLCSTSSRFTIQQEILFFTGVRILTLAFALFAILLQAEVFLHHGMIPDPDAALGITPWWCTSDSPVYVLATNTVLFLFGLACFLPGWLGPKPFSSFFRHLFRNAYKKA